jgi:hypothetical protein
VSTMRSSHGTGGAPAAPMRQSTPSTLPAKGHFAALLREAIDASGLTYRQISAEAGKRLGGILAISHVPIWSWANGRYLPRRRVEEAYKLLAIEPVLGLPTGCLVLALPYEPKVSPLHPASIPTTDASDADRYAAFFDVVYRTWKSAIDSQQLLIRSVRKTYSLNRRGAPQCMTVEMDALAVRDGTRKYVLMHALDSSWQPQITPILGCELGRNLSELVPDGVKQQVHRATEILLPQAINRGETASLGFVIGYSGVASDREFRHILVQPTDRLDLILQFEGPTRPQVKECRWRAGDLELVTAVPAAGNAGRYEISIQGPAPGGYGWRW